MIILNNI